MLPGALVGHGSMPGHNLMVDRGYHDLLFASCVLDKF